MKVNAAEARSGISASEVLNNAKLQDGERLELAAKVLGKPLTEIQKTEVLRLHHEVSKGVYRNGFTELRVMVEALKEVGIGRKESRKLMENGVLGSVAEAKRAPVEVKILKNSELDTVTDNINRNGIVGFLDQLEGKEIDQVTLMAIVMELK